MSEVIETTASDPVKALRREDLAPAVIVTFKKAEPLAVEIDIDAIGWAEMRVIQKFADNASEDEGVEALIGLLSKLTGRDARLFSMRQVNALIEQIGQLNEAANPKNSE